MHNTQYHIQLRFAIVLSLGFLSMNVHWEAPVPSDAQVSVVEAEPDLIQQLSERKVWLARESAAYALHRNSCLSPKQARQIVDLVNQESQAHQVDDLTVMGVIVVESYGEVQATSPVGARGLMQIMPETGHFIRASLPRHRKGRVSLTDVETNIRYGTWYLDHLEKMFPGNQQAVLAAYNWGPGYIQQALETGQELPKEYPNKVLRAREKLRKEMYEYHQAQYWRSLDLTRDPPYFDHHSTEPKNRSRHRDLLVAHGEGKLLRSGPRL